jgi:CHAT domain-containing protein
MWDIESISASVFNKHLFENYQNNDDLPYAMHETSRNFINGRLGDEYQDPFYWSPYIYLGK